MSNEELLSEEFETVVLELDDGSEEEFAIVDSFEYEGGKYVILNLIIDGDALSEDPDDILFMKDDTDENCEDGEIVLSVIESDDEYEAIIDFYTELED